MVSLKLPLPTAGQTLPDADNPVCYSIDVPGGDYSVMLLSWAIGALGKWINYQRDSARTAKAIADSWKPALHTIRQCDTAATGDLRYCGVIVPDTGLRVPVCVSGIVGSGSDMDIRVKPTDECVLEINRGGGWVELYDHRNTCATPRPDTVTGDNTIDYQQAIADWIEDIVTGLAEDIEDSISQPLAVQRIVSALAGIGGGVVWADHVTPLVAQAYAEGAAFVAAAAAYEPEPIAQYMYCGCDGAADTVDDRLLEWLKTAGTELFELATNPLGALVDGITANIADGGGVRGIRDNYQDSGAPWLSGYAPSKGACQSWVAWLARAGRMPFLATSSRTDIAVTIERGDGVDEQHGLMAKAYSEYPGDNRQRVTVLFEFYASFWLESVTPQWTTENGFSGAMIWEADGLTADELPLPRRVSSLWFDTTFSSSREDDQGYLSNIVLTGRSWAPVDSGFIE